MITIYKGKYFQVIIIFDNLLIIIVHKYIQTQYFIEQSYMELGEFEDILETLF